MKTQKQLFVDWYDSQVDSGNIDYVRSVWDFINEYDGEELFTLLVKISKDLDRDHIFDVTVLDKFFQEPLLLEKYQEEALRRLIQCLKQFGQA